MSLLVAWVGCDNHGTTSAYIVADSRVSWHGRQDKYDACRKVFCLRTYPDIIGYCGDVLFPSMVINQLLSIIDSGLFFQTGDGCRKRFEVFKNKLITEFEKFPHNSNTTSGSFQIVYINREIGDRHYLPFSCYTVIWSIRDGWKVTRVHIPNRSEILVVLGSGKSQYMQVHERMVQKATKGTSRTAFHSFVQTIRENEQSTFGGPPQLVGLYRKPKSCGRDYGIIFNRKRYVLGTQVNRAKNYDVLEWRNRLFEVCNGNTKQRLQNHAAQQYNY